MARNDFKVIDGSAGVLRVREQILGAGQGAIINAGEPVKVGGTGENYGIVLADGDPQFATDIFLGIASRDGSASTTANGFVEVQALIPGVGRFRGSASTVTNVDTDAELLVVLFDQIGVDYSAQSFTLDENEGQSNKTTLGLQIIDGDPATSTLVVRPMVEIFGSARVAAP